MHLILTVGTGTAGQQSNLAQGLVNTLKKVKPEGYWLVPSSSSDSSSLADIVREEHPEGFRPWGANEAFWAIGSPDSLEDCRQVVRQVIERARQALPKGQRLLVNPISGTKQMTAGAVLAALDAGLGEIQFTVGQRQDGVVITGTEEIVTFDGARWRAEQALDEAKTLFDAGAYAQAGFLLNKHAERHGDLVNGKLHLCALADAWSSLDFAEAANLAKNIGLERHARDYATLTREARAPQPSERAVSEAYALAEHYRRRHQLELAVHGYYRALELALKLKIWRLTGVAHPWPAQEVESWDIDPRLKQQLLAKTAGNDRCVRAGLSDAAKVLSDLHDPAGAAYFGSRLREFQDMRNEMSHGLESVDAQRVQAMADHFRNFLKHHFELPPPIGVPSWS